MKRENIEQRIKNFFADNEEPERSELIKSTIKLFDYYRSYMPKEISDTRVIMFSLDVMIRHYKMGGLHMVRKYNSYIKEKWTTYGKRT